MKFLQYCWIIIFLFFVKTVWAAPFSVEDTNPTNEATSFLSVTNQDNATKIWAKTYSGKAALIWQHHPALARNQQSILFHADREGNYLSLETTTGDNQTSSQDYTTIVDLQNGFITAPSATLLTYTKDGIGLYSSEQNQNILLLKPIFGSCTNPTIINLNKKNLDLGYFTDPLFEDNTHLGIVTK